MISRKHLCRYSSFAVAIFLSSCSQSKETAEGPKDPLTATRVSALNGSDADIEKMLRYYEECPPQTNHENCARMAEYWMHIGVAFENAGAMSSLINEEKQKSNCQSSLNTLLLILKIRPLIQKSKSEYKYYYNEEESDARKKIKTYCGM